ncbi:MAG TPA: pyridoxal phosphate-dependent aminotransferase [Anaeromyxobacter sp.]|nr:pyridoxal phosphate-dependent aminotransferase [Anaeromyxobacter sp.]
MLSARTAWNLSANALAARLEEARAAGRRLLDLTESNPTRAGLSWPPERLKSALAQSAVAGYDPEPRGSPGARRAVARYLSESRGTQVDPGRILLTASTSEAYGLLLKLLCDPGDDVLVPAPAYPLLDVLAGLEAVALRRYPLRYDGSWHLDAAALARAVGPRSRAVLAVSPANPVGAVLARAELEALEALCAERGLALIVDEVFADTAPADSVSALAARHCLAFHLSGLSKVCGLPQLKVGWLAAAGPEALVGPALARLEVAADAYLSVSGPSQLALESLLPERELFLAPLRRRLSVNRSALAAAAVGASFTPLRGQGGWSAVLRVGETLDEEAVCLDLLDEGVVVQPGFFFDFERSGYLVVSLLTPPADFTQGIGRLARRLCADHASAREIPSPHG